MPAPPFFHSYVNRPARNGWPALLRAWSPVLLFLALLSLESSALLGADRTAAPLHALTHAVSGTQFDAHWTLLHHLIRKIGHFLGYGLFSLTISRALALRNPRAKIGILLSARLHVLAVAGSFVVASLDEMHQAFLPNRTGKFSDVLLDTAGAVVLQFAVRILWRGMRWWKAQQVLFATTVERAAA